MVNYIERKGGTLRGFGFHTFTSRDDICVGIYFPYFFLKQENTIHETH